MEPEDFIYTFTGKNQNDILKFIYSEKATKIEISIVDLSYVVTVKSTVEISQIFVAFSEYMNFNYNCKYGLPFDSITLSNNLDKFCFNL